MKRYIVGLVVLFGGAALTWAADEEKVTVKGEVLDLACYVDHGASGEKHTKCARTCIGSGLPVGIKGEDGKVYMVVGDHKPANKLLEPYAGKVVTLKGTVTSRDGINQLANVELVQ